MFLRNEDGWFWESHKMPRRLKYGLFLVIQPHGVSIDGGTPPSWMVYDGKSNNNMDDLGVPLFQETSNWAHLMETWWNIWWNIMGGNVEHVGWHLHFWGDDGCCWNYRLVGEMMFLPVRTSWCVVKYYGLDDEISHCVVDPEKKQWPFGALDTPHLQSQTWRSRWVLLDEPLVSSKTEGFKLMRPYQNNVDNN